MTNMNAFLELQHEFERAFKFLSSYHSPANHQTKRHLAVVFDIDDTLLYSENDKIFPIPPAISFYKQIKKELPHIRIYFLTARPLLTKDDKINQRQTTIKDLKSVGIILPENCTNLFLMPLYLYPKDECDSNDKIIALAAEYKESIRQYLVEDSRHLILLNVGDQLGDHDGVHYLHHIQYQFNKSNLHIHQLTSSI